MYVKPMTNLKIYNTLEEGIKSFFGESVTIKDESYVSGGDINEAKCIKLGILGSDFFTKVLQNVTEVLQ